MTDIAISIVTLSVMGMLYTLIWLRTGNLLLTAFIHALSNHIIHSQQAPGFMVYVPGALAANVMPFLLPLLIIVSARWLPNSMQNNPH